MREYCRQMENYIETATLAIRDSTASLKTNVVLFYALALAFGIYQRNPTSGIVDLIVPWVFAGLATRFTVIMCSNANKPLPTSSLWLVFLFWPLVVPLILFNARGFRGLGIALLHFAVTYTLYFAPMLY